MNLYKRTVSGEAAALNHLAPLPHELRTLLLSVEGSSPEQTVVKTVPPPGDAAALLESLLQQGYIEIVPTGAPPVAHAGAMPSSAHYQLGSAITLMSDFVLQHLPADSLEIMLALEGLSSVEQVIASLKDYEAMVAAAGPAAVRHLEELRALLSRN